MCLLEPAALGLLLLISYVKSMVLAITYYILKSNFNVHV